MENKSTLFTIHMARVEAVYSGLVAAARRLVIGQASARDALLSIF